MENGNSDYNGYFTKKVLCHVKSHNQHPNHKLYSQDYLKDNKKIEIFQKYSLEYSQLTIRCSSVSQKLHQFGNN